MFFSALTPLLRHYVDEFHLGKAGAGVLAGDVPGGSTGGGHSGRNSRSAARREAHRADRALAACTDYRRLRARGIRLGAGPGALPPGSLERLLMDRGPQLARGRLAGRPARPADRIRFRCCDRRGAVRPRARCGCVLHRDRAGVRRDCRPRARPCGRGRDHTRPGSWTPATAADAFRRSQAQPDDPDRRLALPAPGALFRHPVRPRPSAPLRSRLGRSGYRRDLPRLGRLRSRLVARAGTDLRPAGSHTASSRCPGRLGPGHSAAALAQSRRGAGLPRRLRGLCLRKLLDAGHVVGDRRRRSRAVSSTATRSRWSIWLGRRARPVVRRSAARSHPRPATRSPISASPCSAS